MPQALVALPDVYESVIRRIAIDSVSQLARVMRLPPDTMIMLPGNAETIPMNNGSFGECCDPGLNYPTDGRLVISFTEEIDEDVTLSQHVGTGESLPVFEDPIRSTVMFPIYRTVTMNLNLQYIAPNQNIAQRWLDEMRSRVSQLRSELYQTLEYHYALPDQVLSLLHEVWSKIESSPAPLNINFSDYLDEFLGRPTTTIDTLVGSHPTRAIVEKQYEVLGWFDFTSSPPVPEKDGNNTGSYVCNVGYQFIYDRPTQLLMRWPLVVHNQVIDKTFHPKEAYQTFRQVDRRVSFFKGNLESFLKGIRYDNIPYAIHPDIDDWMPSEMDKSVLVFFTGLVVVDNDNPTGVANISRLGEHTFTPYMLEYIYQQQHTLFDRNTSPFSFRLFENGKERTDITFSFKPGTLELQTDKPLNITKMYHLQLGILRNWLQLTSETRTCLRRYPVVTYTLLRTLGILLGGGEYEDLSLLGKKRPRLKSESCPGQGSIVDRPEDGGTWPWPWLDKEWDSYPYPGYGDPFGKGKWPGGRTDNDYEIGIPTWPGDRDEPNRNPGDGSGVIRDDDLNDAIHETDGQGGNEYMGGKWSMQTVMFASLFVYNGAA